MKNLFRDEKSDFESIRVIVYIEHLLVVLMYIVYQSIETNPQWVKERIREEEFAENIQQNYQERKLNKILKKCDIDILKDQEQKDLEDVYKKGTMVQNLILPAELDDVKLIKVKD